MSTRPESTANNSSDAAPEPHKGNAAADFVRSIAYSAVQEPVSGLTQIADGLLNTNLLPKVQFIAAPEKAQFGSFDWHAQQVGSAVGMLLPFMLVGKGSKALLGGEAAAEAGLLSRTSVIGLSVKQAALSGFAYDAFLRPSDYQQGDRLSFLESRGLNGVTGAASFTALSLSGIGLGKLADSAVMKDTFIAPYLRSNITAGILSGIPAGTVSAELNAWRQGKAVPTLSDLGQTVYGYSMVGGLLGAAHTVKEANPNLSFENLTNKVQDRLSQMRAGAQGAAVKASNLLFPENGWRPAFAGATLGAGNESVEPVVRNTRPLVPPLAGRFSSVSAASMAAGAEITASDRTNGTATTSDRSNGTGSHRTATSNGTGTDRTAASDRPAVVSATTPDTVQQQTENFRKLEPLINRGQDHQDYVQNQLRSTLRTLQRDGKVGVEWEVYPTKAGSPADQIGSDYVLLNTKTSEFHILDATSNLEKFNNPGGHATATWGSKVPAIRVDGLIYYDKRWFDQMGSLRVDPEEPAHIQEGVQQFQKDLARQLTDLSHKPSLLKLGQVEFPEIIPMEKEKAQAQINKFVLSLRALAAKNTGNDRFLLEDFAGTLEKGTSAHLDKTIRTVDSPQLRERIEGTADKVLLSTAVDRVLKRSGNQTKTTNPKSDVSFHGKTNTINLEDDGVIYNSGDMADILRGSRGRMLNKTTVKDTLTKGQWRDLRTAFPSQSDDRIADQIASQVVGMANEVSNGGAVGTGRPVFIDEIVARLKGHPSDSLLGREPAVVEKAAPVEKPPEIAQQFRTMASEFGDLWRKEGFAKPTPGAKLDPDSVELIFDGLMQGKPDAQPYQNMLERYRAGEPVTTKLIQTALQQ